MKSKITSGIPNFWRLLRFFSLDISWWLNFDTAFTLSVKWSRVRFWPSYVAADAAEKLCTLEPFQDFLIKMDMKPRMQLVEISSFYYIVSPSDLPKLWATFSNISKFWFSKKYFSVENWSIFFFEEYLTSSGFHLTPFHSAMHLLLFLLSTSSILEQCL